MIKTCHLIWNEMWVIYFKFTAKLSGASKVSVAKNNIRQKKLDPPPSHMLKSVDLLPKAFY